MGFGWEKSDEACESCAWSKFSWLLLKKTLIWQLLSFDDLVVFLMNHEQILIKWWILIQNLDVDQKSWSLTVCWPQLTFSPIQLILSHLSNLLSKLGDLEDTKKATWDLGNPIFLEKYKTLVVDPLLWMRIYLINS